MDPLIQRTPARWKDLWRFGPLEMSESTLKVPIAGIKAPERSCNPAKSAFGGSAVHNILLKEGGQ